MFHRFMFLKLIILDLILQHSLFELIRVRHLIINSGLDCVRGMRRVQVLEQVVDVLIGVRGQLDLVISIG